MTDRSTWHIWQLLHRSPMLSFVLTKLLRETDMSTEESAALFETRRQFLGRASVGIGSAALASILNPSVLSATGGFRVGGLSGFPNFAPKAKRVIYLFQNGAPSQFELTYMYRGDNNNYIPKIAKCVLENIDVDYSPKDKFTTLKPDNTGASPQLINVSMQFKEMSIITKQSISEGY